MSLYFCNPHPILNENGDYTDPSGTDIVNGMVAVLYYNGMTIPFTVTDCAKSQKLDEYFLCSMTPIQESIEEADFCFTHRIFYNDSATSKSDISPGWHLVEMSSNQSLDQQNQVQAFTKLNNCSYDLLRLWIDHGQCNENKLCVHDMINAAYEYYFRSTHLESAKQNVWATKSIENLKFNLVHTVVPQKVRTPCVTTSVSTKKTKIIEPIKRRPDLPSKRKISESKVAHKKSSSDCEPCRCGVYCEIIDCNLRHNCRFGMYCRKNTLGLCNLMHE